MSCSCDKKIDCSNGTVCTCGIVLKLKDSSGTLVDTLEGTGYIDGSGDLIYQFESGSLFPTGVLTMNYNSTLLRWELRHTDPVLYAPSNDILFGVYETDALCPDTDCDLDLKCNTLDFNSPESTNLGHVEWQGDMYNDRKLYRFYTPDYIGAPGWGNVVIFWGNPSVMQSVPGPGIAHDRWMFAIISPYTLETIPFPLSQIVTTGTSAMSIVGYLTDKDLECPDGSYQAAAVGEMARIATFPDGPQGYTGSIERVECGCCDEEVSVSVKETTQVESNYSALVSRDANGNIIGHNGQAYYMFNDGSRDLFIYFNGTSWAIGGNFSEELYSSSFDGDCPYAFYTSLPTLLNPDPGKIIQIKGVECFDCCDYYTPRFTNFIKKQRAILVDETSYIRKKEVFGLQCGGDWEDLFRKHLIIDTLSCLPYGVLCEEQEECLIENLSKNCNC